MIILGLLFLSVPVLIFLGIINSIVSGSRKKHVRDERKMMKYDNPEGWTAMRDAEQKEFWTGLALKIAGVIIILILILASGHH